MFGLGSSNFEYGVVIDVGSGSVAGALIASKKNAKRPEILWSTRKFFVAKVSRGHEEAPRQIANTIRAVLDEYTKHGTKLLIARGSNASVTRVQLSLSAPWSHSVVRCVHVKHDKKFQLTNETIGSIAQTATNKAKELLKSNGLDTTDFSLLSNTALSTTINGYEVRNPENKMVTEVTITHLIDFAYADVAQRAIDEIDRVFTSVEIRAHSFMHLFFAALCDLDVDAKDACLIDVTNEATEVGVVQDSSLIHVAHIEHGIRSLARSADGSNADSDNEILGHIRGSEVTLSKEQRAQLSETEKKYDAALHTLFEAQSSILAVPKTIFLHTDERTESYFADRLKQAFTTSTDGAYTIHNVTSRFFDDMEGDSALLLSAFVLHRRPYDCDWH